MRIIKVTIFILFIIFCYSSSQGKAEEQKRAMTFLDIIQMRSLGMRGSGDISPDGKWFVYTIRVPEWGKNKNMKIPFILCLLYNGLRDLFLLFLKSQFWKPNRMRNLVR